MTIIIQNYDMHFYKNFVNGFCYWNIDGFCEKPRYKTFNRIDNSDTPTSVNEDPGLIKLK